MINRDELDEITKEAMVEVPRRIQSIVTKDSHDRPNLATCTYIRYKEKNYAITCAHVVESATHVWAGLPMLSRPMIDGEEIKLSESTDVLFSDDKIDIAVLDGDDIDYQSINKLTYDIELSNNISYESTLKELATLSFMCGLWGEKARIAPFDDGVVYAELPMYFAFGPIKKVEEDLIICDFAEREKIQIETPGYMQLENVRLTGGSRNLSGTSGSGLWVHNGTQLLLVGILLGPVSSNADEQLIRFTPIWRIMELLDSNLS